MLDIMSKNPKWLVFDVYDGLSKMKFAPNKMHNIPRVKTSYEEWIYIYLHFNFLSFQPKKGKIFIM
jgi:hypothetical protein